MDMLMLVPACMSCQAPCFKQCCQFCGWATCWNCGPCVVCYPQAMSILSHQLIAGDTGATALVEASAQNIYALLRNSEPGSMVISIPLRDNCIMLRVGAPEIVSWSQDRSIGIAQIAKRLSKDLEWDIPSGIVLVNVAIEKTLIFTHGEANDAFLGSAISYVRRFEGSVGIMIKNQECYLFEVVWSIEQTQRLTRSREIILMELNRW